jgi:excisionase family DNA binding protein
MTSKFYTPLELSEILRVNKMTIYRYIRAGKIKAYKIGKDYRIEESEYQKFLKSIATK